MKCRHRFHNIGVLAAAAILGAFFLASCPKAAPKSSPLPSPTDIDTSPLKLEPLPSDFPAAIRKAVIVYIEGKASSTRAGVTKALDMGDEILAGDSVETGPKSSCEIRFGNAAIVRLEENSILSVNAALLEGTRNRVDIALSAGTLFNKVEKLLKADSYVVRGPAMVCGVRGTEFLMHAESSGYTLLAVNSGTVKALPASAALTRIADASRTNGVARAALKAVLSLGPEVGAGMELSFRPDDAARAEKTYAKLEKIIAETPVEPIDPADELPGIVPAADMATTRSADAALLAKFAMPAAGFGKPAPASEKTKALFSGFERMKPETRSQAPSPKPAPLDPAILGVHGSGRKPVVGEIVQFKGLVLLSNSDGEIAAYDSDGREVWRTRTGNPGSSQSYPMVFKDKIYYSGSSSFDIIDGKTGAIIKTTPFVSASGGRDGLRPYQFPGGILAPRANGIDLIDPDTGEVRDSIDVPEGLMMSPASLKAKTVVYVTSTGIFRLVRAADKTVIKEIQTEARGISQQTLRNRGTLYFFADGSGMAVLIDADADRPLWQRRIDGALASEAEMGKAAVYLPTAKGLAVIALSDGELVQLIPGISGPPLLSNDDLFLCTDSGELIVARANPYTELTRISLPFVGSARPLIVGKTLWVAGRGGKMVRIDPELLRRRAKAES
jgi:hypothetical protein